MQTANTDMYLYTKILLYVVLHVKLNTHAYAAIHAWTNESIVCCLLSSGFRGLPLDSIAVCLAPLMHGSFNTTLVVGRAGKIISVRSASRLETVQVQGPPRTQRSSVGLLARCASGRA